MCLLVCLFTNSVGETGLEPATFAMSTRCSNQLSYPPEQAHIITRVGKIDNALPISLLLQFVYHQGYIILERTSLGEISQRLQNLLDQPLGRMIAVLTNHLGQSLPTKLLPA